VTRRFQENDKIALKSAMLIGIQSFEYYRPKSRYKMGTIREFINKLLNTKETKHQ
jgi:hypothetical protein